jgi:hypothetical protein
MKIQKILSSFKRDKFLVNKTRKKKRRSIRVPIRNTVHFVGHNEPPAHSSSVTNLSYKGTCIKTKTLYIPGTKIYMLIENGERSYEAKGVVVWAEEVSPGLAWILKNRMGIRFTDVDLGLVALYQEKIKAKLVKHGRLEIH